MTPGSAQASGGLVVSIHPNDVPKYSQGNSSWKNNALNGCPGQTIGSAGCTITAAASLLSFYGFNSSPSILNTEMGNNSCPFYWDAMETHAAGGNKVKVNKAQRDQGYSAFNPMAQVELDAGRPVIVGMKEDANPSHTHFVLVRGYIKYGPTYTPTASDYSIMDPADGTYKSLSSYVGNGWTIHRAYSYIIK